MVIYEIYGFTEENGVMYGIFEITEDNGMIYIVYEIYGIYGLVRRHTAFFRGGGGRGG